MTDKELLRGEIRETIRLYRLGLNKKTLEALVDDMEAIFKQEMEGSKMEKLPVKYGHITKGCLACHSYVGGVENVNFIKENNGFNLAVDIFNKKIERKIK